MCSIIYGHHKLKPKNIDHLLAYFRVLRLFYFEVVEVLAKCFWQFSLLVTAYIVQIYHENARYPESSKCRKHYAYFLLILGESHEIESLSLKWLDTTVWCNVGCSTDKSPGQLSVVITHFIRATWKTYF